MNQSQGSDAAPENLDVQECESLNDGSSDFPQTSSLDITCIFFKPKVIIRSKAIIRIESLIQDID